MKKRCLLENEMEYYRASLMNWIDKVVDAMDLFEEAFKSYLVEFFRIEDEDDFNCFVEDYDEVMDKYGIFYKKFSDNQVYGAFHVYLIMVVDSWCVDRLENGNELDLIHKGLLV